MLITEWNIEEAKEVWFEEGFEEGFERGREEVLALLSKGYTLEAIREELEIGWKK